MLSLYFEDEAAARRFWRLVGLAACGLLALAFTCFWLGRPLYRHYKEEHLAALARRFLQSGQNPNALFTA